ncbi:MAG: META domain-containing protein [Anaerolineales bacterium]|jgi:heat shock protein HslJ
MKLINTLTVITWIAIMLAACGGSGGDPLNNTSWELTALGEQPPLAGTTISLSFEDGLARGTSGCNSYGGAYKVNGDRIEFQEFEATVMACPDTGVMEQETAYLKSLGEAQSFELSEGQLQIFGSEGETLTFVPAK